MSIASIEEYKEIDMEKNLEPQAECCIYRVPKILRKINEEAYTPRVISIGPFHHGKEELISMEKQKIRYKRDFRKLITPETWQEMITFVEKQEPRIRSCYQEMPKFQKLEFVAMILYDAIFIIEFFLRHYNKDKLDFLISNPQTRISIWLDLQLLENQLPYFVLDELYNLAFPYSSFFSLSCAFFGPGFFNEMPAGLDIKHFTDFKRYSMIKMHLQTESMMPSICLPSAHKLHESGVSFKRIEGNCLLDMKFEKKKLRNIPWFKVHELQIPHIKVYDETECLIRNVMALEQCHYPRQALVCSYIYLMDALINTEEDVNSLVEAGVISNHVGENARVAEMFNKLGMQIDVSHTYHREIIKDLKAHYDNPWNHATATLKRVYFSNLWRGTATVAAIMLLLLALIQAVCSILQVV